MKALLQFDEISAYIAEHYNHNIYFSHINEKELKVSFSKKIIIKNISIDITIGIKEISPTSLDISYSGGLGMDMIISGVLIFLKNKVPEVAEGIINEKGNNLKLELAKIPQLENAFQYIGLKDIAILPDAIEINADLI